MAADRAFQSAKDRLYRQNRDYTRGVAKQKVSQRASGNGGASSGGHSGSPTRPINQFDSKKFPGLKF